MQVEKQTKRGIMSVTITFVNAPEELSMNLSNDNFIAFFTKLLGNAADYVGEAKALTLYNLCKNFKPKTLVQDAYAEDNYYNCGRTLEQVTRYKWALMRIAVQAMKEGKPIHWA